MNQDGWGDITNGSNTYEIIAKKLKEGINVIIGWTDEEVTHYDILFSAGAYREYGNVLQGGIIPQDLFVSIMRRGSFGFLINEDELSAGYVGEKLNISDKVTCEKVAELITEIRRLLK